jgi:hypothetical protein
MIAKAFEEGVKAALKFFQNPRTIENLAKAADAVRKNLTKAAKLAAKAKR